jgi:hypothetical protein
MRRSVGSTRSCARTWRASTEHTCLSRCSSIRPSASSQPLTRATRRVPEPAYALRPGTPSLSTRVFRLPRPVYTQGSSLVLRVGRGSIPPHSRPGPAWPRRCCYRTPGASLPRDLSGAGRGRRDRVPSRHRRRNTDPGRPVALTRNFFEDAAKRTQWAAFLRRARLDPTSVALDDVAVVLQEFLLPPMLALARHQPPPTTWTPPGPWRTAAGEE